MPGYSYEQLTRVPFVMRLIREYRAPGTTFQRYYNLGMMNTPGQVLPQRTGVYDIFQPTRSMPVGRAPMSGPARVARKPVGQKMITVPRFHEALSIEDEYVFRTRPLGAPYWQVDQNGQNYIAKQQSHEIQKFSNLHEFMAVSVFRGGWGLKRINEDMLPVLKSDPNADIIIDTQMPVEQTGQIPLGGPTNTDPIIDVSWDDPSADLVKQFMELDKVHAARYGAPITDVWLNNTTLAPLFNNTKLQAVGGSVYRIWDSLTGRERNPDEPFPDTGITVKFRALPQQTFHSYNQVVKLDLTPESSAADLDFANLTYLIPDNEAIFTPSGSEFVELIAGTEPMQWSINQAPQVISGFGLGRAREIDPPRTDMKYLLNQCPALVQPYACYNPTVIYP